MKTYAVFKTFGKQYLVTEGQDLKVDKLNTKEGAKVKFDNVLLTIANGQVKVGKPIVKGAYVSALVTSVGKDKKIKVAKFKAKSRYRKTIGHRQLMCKIKVEDIIYSTKDKN